MRRPLVRSDLWRLGPGCASGSKPPGRSSGSRINLLPAPSHPTSAEQWPRAGFVPGHSGGTATALPSSPLNPEGYPDTRIYKVTLWLSTLIRWGPGRARCSSPRPGGTGIPGRKGKCERDMRRTLAPTGWIVVNSPVSGLQPPINLLRMLTVRSIFANTASGVGLSPISW
jgi:hypothetical protein